jgi:hypothetical protein
LYGISEVLSTVTKEYYVLKYYAMSGTSLLFRRNILPWSSGRKNNPSSNLYAGMCMGACVYPTDKTYTSAVTITAESYILLLPQLPHLLLKFQ